MSHNSKDGEKNQATAEATKEPSELEIYVLHEGLKKILNTEQQFELLSQQIRNLYAVLTSNTACTLATLPVASAVPAVASLLSAGTPDSLPPTGLLSAAALATIVVRGNSLNCDDSFTAVTQVEQAKLADGDPSVWICIRLRDMREEEGRMLQPRAAPERETKV